MPLAPQITNTPIPASTWYVSTDFQTDAGGIATVQTTTTFYANPTPTASAIGDIWFDISNGNKQHRWDGSTWADVQDTAISTAASDASTALSTANSAQTSANGKNKITYSSNTPSGSGTNTGDIWWQYLSGNIIGQWAWNGSSWVSSPITSSVIANLDAGKITSGTISSIEYNNGSGTFHVTSAGALTASSATITGTIQATSGWIGNSSSGWLFTSGGYITNSGATTALYPNISANSFALITDRAVAAQTGFQSGNSTGSYLRGASVSSSAGWVSQGHIVPGDSTGSGIDAAYSIGSSSFRWNYIYSAHSAINTSDQRVKNDIQPAALGLNFISKLNPVSFKMNVGNVKTTIDDKGETVATPIAGTRRHYGFIAQEVKAALEGLVDNPDLDFAGWTMDDPTDPESRQGLVYDYFIAPLVKAVQELTARVAALEAK